QLARRAADTNARALLDQAALDQFVEQPVEDVGIVDIEIEGDDVAAADAGIGPAFFPGPVGASDQLVGHLDGGPAFKVADLVLVRQRRVDVGQEFQTQLCALPARIFDLHCGNAPGTVKYTDWRA